MMAAGGGSAGGRGEGWQSQSEEGQDHCMRCIIKSGKIGDGLVDKGHKITNEAFGRQ